VLTVAVPAFGPELFWGENNLINLLVILLNVGVGIGMIGANIQHLKVQDEMMQKVQLEAMGIYTWCSRCGRHSLFHVRYNKCDSI
jgi:hypothetical protein